MTVFTVSFTSHEYSTHLRSLKQ